MGTDEVEPGAQEEGDRQPVSAIGRRDHAVDVGPQVTAGGHLEELADVDDEGSGNRWRCNPALLALDLQAAHLVLQEYGDEAESLWAPTPWSPSSDRRPDSG